MDWQRRWSNFFEGADAFISYMVGFALAAPGLHPAAKPRLAIRLAANMGNSSFRGHSAA
jgi:hypothetical protein